MHAPAEDLLLVPAAAWAQGQGLETQELGFLDHALPSRLAQGCPSGGALSQAPDLQQGRLHLAGWLLLYLRH